MSDSDAPHLVTILYQFWSFANQILKIADLLRSYLNTHNCVIKSESKLQIPLLDYPLFQQFLSFSHQTMEFIIKVSVDSFCEEELLNCDCIIMSQFRDGSGPTLKKNSELEVSFNFWHFQGIINLIRCVSKLWTHPSFLQCSDWC